MRVGEAESLSIRTMRAPDAGPVTRVWHASWMDTYVRPRGISAQDAQARWARHGFVLVPGSRRLHDGIIPEVTMRRAPGGAPGRDGA